tara:strand:+ start:5281 stop:5664 length:384 start_codon:yes stop_codon:yes gene_type:complete
MKDIRDWRESNPPKQSQGRFPDKIKDSIVSLSEEMDYSDLASEFEISERTIKKWIDQSKRESTDPAGSQFLAQFMDAFDATFQDDIKPRDAQTQVRVVFERNNSKMTAFLEFEQFQKLVFNLLSSTS